jgi:hypothetical protein
MRMTIVIEICAVAALVALLGSVFWTMGKEIYREIIRRVELDELNERKRKEGEEMSKAPSGD